MSEMQELVREFDTKYEQRWPGLLKTSPQANSDAIAKVRDLFAGVDLVEDILDLARVHNGAARYPCATFQCPLPQNLAGLLKRISLWIYAAPLDPRYSVPVFRTDFDFLYVPLTGEYRGAAFRISQQVDFYGGKASGSLKDLFRSWIFCLDEGILARQSHISDGDVYIADSAFIGSSDLYQADILEQTPKINPLILVAPESADQGFVELWESRSIEDGFDPRVYYGHPEHDEYTDTLFEQFETLRTTIDKTP